MLPRLYIMLTAHVVRIPSLPQHSETSSFHTQCGGFSSQFVLVLASVLSFVSFLLRFLFNTFLETLANIRVSHQMTLYSHV